MKAILLLLFLAATLPAFGQTATGKTDKPVVYDRNGRQVLPYDRLEPRLCPRADLTPPACTSAEKPAPQKRPKHIG